VADRVHIPDVIEPEEKLPQDLVVLRRFARFMDEEFEIPGTKLRFGADAILGLIPGIGDVIGAVFSSWIIAGALRHRVPALVILRMIANVVVDLVFGAVPLAGDVFDFLWEENMKNMRLLEKHRNRSLPPRSTAQIALILGLIVAFFAGVALAVVAGLIAGIVWLIGQRPLL